MAKLNAPVIVVGCQKGGIGRTALAVNLAAMLALSGRRTLLVDLDAKGDATASVGVPLATSGKSLARFSEPWSFLKDTETVRRPAGMDIWPGGPAISKLRAELSTDTPTDLLGKGLALARKRYRAIVIDAPPDLGPLGRSALASCDVLLLPISRKAFMERALEETITTALKVRDDFQVLGVRLQTQNEDLLEDDEEEPEEGPLGVELLDCAICYDAQTFNKAASEGLPVFEAAPGSRAAHCFIELGREVVEKVLKDEL